MTSSRKRTRVLWLTKGLGPGGAERLLASFAQRADHDRFEFHAAYLLPWKDHLVGDLEAAGVAVHCLDAPHPYDLRWIRRLRRLVRDQGIDVVHNHSPLVAGQARLALRALPRDVRPALVGTEHNVWSSHRPMTRLLNRMTLGLEAQTFAVSDEVRASIAPGRRPAVDVLVHGVDVATIRARREERYEARRRLCVGDELVVVTVANLRANKDYPTMLRATRRLVDDGVEVTVLSVGQGPLEASLAELRDTLDLRDHFRFLGYQPDPIGVLAAADVFCLSSRYEGLPIALLEAMALGIPPVATNVGGIPQVITDGVDGVLVPAGDPTSLADAIAAMTDAGRRASIATAAIGRGAAFDIDSAADEQQSLYIKVGLA